MKTFQITRPDETIRKALTDKINNLTKPKGSLGTLEELALQIGLIQQTLTPELRHHQISYSQRSWHCRRGSQPLSQRDHLATNQQFSSRRGRCQLPLPPARIRVEDCRCRSGLRPPIRERNHQHEGTQKLA